MGLGFGQLAKIRGIIYYKLSPFEQRAFAGIISNGVPNTFRRIAENVFTVAPPFILSYIIFTTTEKEHERLMRKNPKDFENDQ